MTIEKARKEFPMWAFGQPLEKDEYPQQKEKFFLPVWFDRFKRDYSLTIIAAIAFTIWTVAIVSITGAIVRHNTEIEVTDRLTHEWRANMQAQVEREEQERMAINLLTGEASLAATMDSEADAIARVIGTLSTKRMKQTEIWNILCRVDSPYYANTVEDVVAQPLQWMFYSENNPIREDDKALALEQLKLWHEGRYPAGLSNAFVYGEWSETDYVLRDRWEKDSKTQYWRMPE